MAPMGGGRCFHWHTHGHNNTEQAADYAVNDMIQLIVFRLGAIQCPVRVFLLHAEAEQVGLGDDEIQILVE